MTSILFLASAESSFILHSTIAFFLGGVLFFAGGVAAGWLLWRRLPAEAARLERENLRLQQAYEKREKSFRENRSIVSLLVAGEKRPDKGASTVES